MGNKPWICVNCGQEVAGSSRCPNCGAGRLSIWNKIDIAFGIVVALLFAGMGACGLIGAASDPKSVASGLVATFGIVCSVLALGFGVLVYRAWKGGGRDRR